MKRTLTVWLALLLAMGVWPAAGATPYGREDNAVGTLRWLPDNALERTQVTTGTNRLVVIYDSSITEAGAPRPLLAKGPFGMKFLTASHNVRMKRHSTHVGALDDLTGQPALAAADEAFTGVYGDVRDGACAKVGTPAFSAAYSTRRSFFVPGTAPYEPTSAPGACEVVESSVARADASGFDTTVRTFVPGFWIDVEWPAVVVPLGLANGRMAAEVWYGVFYDDDGDNGPFYEVGDTTGASKSVGSPGDYAAMFSFTANPGSVGAPCPGFPGVTNSPGGTWQDVNYTVPEDAKSVTFKLFPKGDWDLRIVDPDGVTRDSGFFGGIEETVVVPGGTMVLRPGETYIMRACNYTGEQTTFGAVLVQR